MTPSFIRPLITSAAVRFMREASSPTEISSGIDDLDRDLLERRHLLLTLQAASSSPAPPDGACCRTAWSADRTSWSASASSGPWTPCAPPLRRPAYRHGRRTCARLTSPVPRVSMRCTCLTLRGSRSPAPALFLRPASSSCLRGRAVALRCGLLWLAEQRFPCSSDLMMLGHIFENNRQIGDRRAPAYGSSASVRYLVRISVISLVDTPKSFATSCTRYLLSNAMGNTSNLFRSKPRFRASIGCAAQSADKALAQFCASLRGTQNRFPV